MKEVNLIPVDDIVAYHEVEFTFITSLKDAGLITFKEVNQKALINEAELHKLEKMIRLHYELEINIAGIEAINHLLERIEQMQSEISVLKNRAQVKFY